MILFEKYSIISNMDKKIREPRQERSIDKKNKIIDTAYEVFSSVGYYNTNTADIAKKAGVSTGIVYGYFKDKRDILLYCTRIYMGKVSLPLVEYMKELSSPIDFSVEVPKIIDIATNIHKSNANLHNTLHSLSVSDKDVAEVFLEFEESVTVKASERLVSLGVPKENLREKVHIEMNLIQSFAHESVYDKHPYIDYEVMKNSVVKIVVALFI